jgi:DNA-3-methyladenine glycosylase II
VRARTSREGNRDSAKMEEGLSRLLQIDSDLRRVHRELGSPPLWPREPGFATLVHIILEQQVSLASARAAFDRLRATTGPITPISFLTLSDAALLKIGFSRQKTSYCRYLANALVRKEIDLETLAMNPDDSAVRSELMKLKGIGAWTADIYLLMALRRPDVWPVGDLALAVALREVKRLERRPGPNEMEQIAAAWRPHRAVAARLLWHHYLSTPRRRTAHASFGTTA